MNQDANLFNQDGLPVLPFRSDKIPSEYVRIQPEMIHELERQAIENADFITGYGVGVDKLASQNRFLSLHSVYDTISITFRLKVALKGVYHWFLGFQNNEKNNVRLTVEINDQKINSFVLPKSREALWLKQILKSNHHLIPGFHKVRLDFQFENSNQIRELKLDRLILQPQCADDDSIRYNWEVPEMSIAF
jgi:hypothetical protein